MKASICPEVYRMKRLRDSKELMLNLNKKVFLKFSFCLGEILMNTIN